MTRRAVLFALAVASAAPRAGAETSQAPSNPAELHPRLRRSAAGGHPETLEAPQAGRIRALAAQHFKAGGPGAALLVMRDGRLAFAGAVGLASIPAGRPLSVDGAFDLASCSKQFTAMAALMLADRRRLSLDDDIRRFLPELPVFDPRRPIRVRDLMGMTSGLADYVPLVGSGGTSEQAVAAVGKKALLFPTGSRHKYSNTDYLLLGLIVKRVSKMTYGEFLRREIFGPLGMTHSAVREGDAAIPNRVFGYARGEDGGWVLDVDDTPGLVGDGGVFSTVGDLALWDRAVRRNAFVRDPELRKMTSTSALLDSGAPSGYSAGWVFDGRRASHTGGWAGTSTSILRFLDRDLTVIVLSNWDEGKAEELGDEIAALFD